MERNPNIEAMKKDILSRKVIEENPNKSEEELYHLIEGEYIKHMSYRWFSGSFLVYPSYKETRSKKSCSSVTGTLISSGTLYIDYKALMVNIYSGEKYVLKHNLKLDLDSAIPSTIQELEDLEEESLKITGKDFQIKKVRSKNKKNVSLYK